MTTLTVCSHLHFVIRLPDPLTSEIDPLRNWAIPLSGSLNGRISFPSNKNSEDAGCFVWQLFISSALRYVWLGVILGFPIALVSGLGCNPVMAKEKP